MTSLATRTCGTAWRGRSQRWRWGGRKPPSAAAQADGTVAAFLLVLCCRARSGEEEGRRDAPEAALAVVMAGSVTAGLDSSFLYAPQSLEAARTDALVRRCVHRAVALGCRGPLGGGGRKALVRIAEKRLEESHPRPFSAAADALVACVVAEGPAVATPRLISLPPRVDDSPAGDLVTFVDNCACDSRLAGAGGVSVGPAVRGAALGLISALGEIADGRSDARDDSPAHSLARELTVRELPTCVAGMLAACVRSAEGVSGEDLALRGSPVGVLFRPGGGGRTRGRRRRRQEGQGAQGKGTGGAAFASSLEDEEWERQVREDLAKKKRASSSSGRVPATLTPWEEELLSGADGAPRGALGPARRGTAPGPVYQPRLPNEDDWPAHE